MSVQQTIIKGIKEQLFFNDYLVLPNFGGFVLKSKAAHFSSTGGLIVPPSKTVSFNAQLKQNDGILALWLQSALKCHASDAMKHLEEFSEFCSGILAAKRRLTLEGIGFFYLDFENNICFEPQQDANFLVRSFGLSPVSFKEIEVVEVSPEPKKETVFVDRTLISGDPSISPQRTRRNYNKLVTPLLIAILMVSLLGLLLNNVRVKGELSSSLSGQATNGSYTPFDYDDLMLESALSPQKAYVADANGIAALELSSEKKVAVKVFEAKFGSVHLTDSKSSDKHFARAGNFEIVLGCFTVLENANRMVTKLKTKHIHAEVTGKNNKGMYVVSNGKYSTKDDAVSRLQQVKEEFPHAWIKKD